VTWLLDTNVVSETIRRRPSPAVINWIARTTTIDINISIVVMAEIVEGIGLNPDADRRRELKYWFDTTIADWLGEHTLPLTVDILVDWRS
jgi:toxin FitB